MIARQVLLYSRYLSTGYLETCLLNIRSVTMAIILHPRISGATYLTEKGADKTRCVPKIKRGIAKIKIMSTGEVIFCLHPLTERIRIPQYV